VVTQTQLITGADVGIPRIGHGPQVGYKQWSARHDAAALLDAELKRLRQEDVHASDIVVVSLRDSVQDSAATLSKSYRTGRLATITPSDGYAVPLVTSSDFKGLEAPHVLVVDVDDISDEGQRSRLYVAMTRPRISLWLAVSDIAWQQMAARSGRTK
jgi:superfamily I DNA/RNA helicase